MFQVAQIAFMITVQWNTLHTSGFVDDVTFAHTTTTTTTTLV